VIWVILALIYYFKALILISKVGKIFAMLNEGNEQQQKLGELESVRGEVRCEP